MNEHISDDQLIQRLYGLETGAGHFEACSECRAHYHVLETRRLELAEPLDLSTEQLAAQRRAIYSRMGETPRTLQSWVPALATAALAAIGLFIAQPSHKPAAPAPAEVPDEQLFSEIVSMEQSMEPRAIAPIRALFEESEQQ